jgi:uncharacterized alkaline shock family protein YloU
MADQQQAENKRPASHGMGYFTYKAIDTVMEGVASVGENAIASGLISVFTAKPVSNEPAVESDVVDDKLVVSVRLSVFYGYPFTKLAADVRSAVAAAVKSQMGVTVGKVDVCIDNLVFPKE